MTKKKEKEESVFIVTKEELTELKAKFEEHQAAIEGFRTSFQNFDLKIKNLIERNRLR
jgi:hypothetical protein